MNAWDDAKKWPPIKATAADLLQLFNAAAGAAAAADLNVTKADMAAVEARAAFDKALTKRDEAEEYMQEIYVQYMEYMKEEASR